MSSYWTIITLLTRSTNGSIFARESVDVTKFVVEDEMLTTITTENYATGRVDMWSISKLLTDIYDSLLVHRGHVQWISNMLSGTKWKQYKAKRRATFQKAETKIFQKLGRFEASWLICWFVHVTISAAVVRIMPQRLVLRKLKVYWCSI